MSRSSDDPDTPNAGGIWTRRKLLGVLGGGILGVSGGVWYTRRQPSSTPPENKLVPPDFRGDAQFGTSIALSGGGTTALIGAPERAVQSEPTAGSAYVFEQVDEEWVHQTTLTADEVRAYEGFGNSVAVSDDATTFIIGATTNAVGGDNVSPPGVAYIFERENETWTQRAKLGPVQGRDIELFGTSVAISDDGTTAIVGATNDDNTNGEGTGAAYLFHRDGGVWSRQAKLIANDGDTQGGGEDGFHVGAGFGVAVAMSADGTTVLVGANTDDNGGVERPGAAYVFTRDNGEWTQRVKLTPDDPNKMGDFGWSVTVSANGSTGVVGVPNDNNRNGSSAGAAYIVRKTGSEWSKEVKLTAKDGDGEDYFGSSAAISDSGTTAVVGAGHGKDPNGEEVGSVYVFERTNGTWGQQAKHAAQDGSEYDDFGDAVAVSADGTMRIVGAPGDSGPKRHNTGSAYVFDP